jgi:hypothetical protein
VASELLPAVAEAIDRFSPRSIDEEGTRFVKELVLAARPESVNRAKAFLFAASRLAAFAQAVGLELTHEALVRTSAIERCCAPGVTPMSAPTRRTVRTNLRAIATRVAPDGPSLWRLSREQARPPYTRGEIAAYLALCDAQPTESRRLRAAALVCLSAGAGLVGTDLKAVRGTDVVVRSGGVLVCVASGRRPRAVPVLQRFCDRLVAAASVAGSRLLIGGTSTSRRNVTTPITASLAGGRDLPRLDVSRLRSTWLCEVAEAIGLRTFMDAAGIVCSQRLGDLVGHLPEVTEAKAVALIGGSG